MLPSQVTPCPCGRYFIIDVSTRRGIIMEKADIIARIGYIRVRAKLTQKALSYTIGMNPNYINRLESKKDFLPSLEVLLKIIEACHSTPEEFFYHDITQYERDRELSEKIENLPAHVKEFVLSYDPELMDMSTRLNEKFVRLKKNNTE